MVPKDQKFTNLKVDEVLVVGKAVITRELVVTAANSAKLKNATVDNLTVVNDASIGGALTLATPGGTASPLNFYQEFSGIVTFSGSALNASVDTTIHLTRVGKVVTMTLDGFIGVGSAFVPTPLAGTAIPAQFRPVVTFNTMMSVIDNALDCAGFLQLDASGGTFTMYRGTVSGDILIQGLFSAVGDTGCKAFTTSWIAA